MIAFKSLLMQIERTLLLIVFSVYTLHIYTQSVMASVAVSVLARTSVHLVDPGIKVNGKYYWDVLLTRDLLPEIRQYSE